MLSRKILLFTAKSSGLSQAKPKAKPAMEALAWLMDSKSQSHLKAKPKALAFRPSRARKTLQMITVLDIHILIPSQMIPYP